MCLLLVIIIVNLGFLPWRFCNFYLLLDLSKTLDASWVPYKPRLLSDVFCNSNLCCQICQLEYLSCFDKNGDSFFIFHFDFLLFFRGEGKVLISSYLKFSFPWLPHSGVFLFSLLILWLATSF